MKTIRLVALGNPVMSDDGAGPFLLKQLEKANWPCRVAFHNTGTASLDYLQLLKKNDFIFILDALCTGRPPGTVVKLAATQLRLTLSSFSLHNLHLLHLAQGFYPHRLKQIMIYGIEPLSLEPGTKLSHPVRQGLPLLNRIVTLDIMRFNKNKNQAENS